MSTFHGTEVLIAAKTADTVAFTDADQCQDISVTQEGNVINRHELGARAPQELKAGKIETDFTITRFWEAGNFSAVGATLQAAWEAATELWFAIYPEGDASPEIIMNECKITSWGVSVNIDGILVETIGVKALSVDISYES
jgi:hypothetical protein